MNQGFPENELLLDVQGGLAVVTLNRPKALNALSAGMIEGLVAVLAEWEKNPAIRTVYIKGAGDRAFCSGGDVKAVWQAGKGGKRIEQLKYFAAEYALDAQIFHYKKPIVAFMDGITMGGGYGIAGNCKYRIATEKTIFAMPETGIGFFTDVGSVYHLSRTPGSVGRYLALSGLSISGVDMIYARLADGFIASSKQDELMTRLRTEEAGIVLADMAQRPRECDSCELQKRREEIDDCFTDGVAEDVIESLTGSEWAEQTRAVIESRSPTSVRICDMHLWFAAGQEFDAVIGRDLLLAGRFMENPDFYEGIRAALVDKDRKPLWNPATLAEFPPEIAESWFK
jgi:enoyl-CoA hydratase